MAGDIIKETKVSVSIDRPVPLTDGELDLVSGGAFADAFSNAFASGLNFAATNTSTSASANSGPVFFGPFFPPGPSLERANSFSAARAESG